MKKAGEEYVVQIRTSKPELLLVQMSNEKKM